MPSVDDAPLDGRLEARDRLRHDLKSPLTTISGRAQLLERVARRSTTMTATERAAMLAGLATIEAAVLVLVATIDAIGAEEAGPSPRP
jgi:signal transduction histidine kinase